jgi:hypothetical protein
MIKRSWKLVANCLKRATSLDEGAHAGEEPEGSRVHAEITEQVYFLLTVTAKQRYRIYF